MSPVLVNAVGVAAALCSMWSFVPQAMKIWRERDAGAVSLRMYVATVAGFALWTVYGVALGSWPLTGSNLVCLGLSGSVLALKISLDRRQRKGPREDVPRPSSSPPSGEGD